MNGTETAISSGIPRSTLRWQVIPATLSAALGTILFLMNCIHLRDAMLPEIVRAFDPTTNFTVAHGIMCIIASTTFFGASACAFAASREWLASKYQTAMAFCVSIPVLIVVGVFLMYR